MLARIKIVAWPGLAGLLMLLAGCAAAQAARDARLRVALDDHRLHEPCSTVWPVALHVLADHGYELVGNDRAVAGQPAAGLLQNVTGGGFETTQVDHGLVAETMEDSSGRFRNNLRYRVQGLDPGGGTCRVTFTAIQRIRDSLDVSEFRDPDMELDLMRRIDPEEAARIVQEARAGH